MRQARTRSTAIVAAIFALGILLGCTLVMAQEVTQKDNAWFSQGQAAIQEKLARQPITGPAKNIILFIANGNDVATNYATRLYHGQDQGNYGEEHVLPHETFPYLALVKTYNTNAQTPDASGSATAILAGVKTRSGVVGVDETVTQGDCQGGATGHVQSLAEILSAAGKSVGIVSTARITHATPAAAYAHTADHNYEDDSGLSEGCTVPDIAVQLIEKMKSGEVDLAMGGGRRHFLPAEVQGDEGKAGSRQDGRNLVQEAIGAGAQYAWNSETFNKIGPGGNSASAPLLGLFESSHMQYEHDRNDEPSLAEMTSTAIEYLSGNEKGYFISIEGGRVDHASHAGNLHRTVTDGVAFAEAVAMASDMTDAQETLIIVTANRGQALAFNGNCGRGTPITGLCYDIDKAGEKHADNAVLADDGNPYSVANYLNGAGSILLKQSDGSYLGTRPTITQEEATDRDYVQHALIPLASETHSGVDVAAYARGPWAHLVDGTIEQSFLFHVMYQAAFAE